ncbi:U3 snoRNP-associated protein Utp7 [Schizosaccharomyces japonicus yFS275]|uniref:U3 snoRNP-associated protein Utp7 n=1 Tax=Schizosaccharomyces japonicus (strain yFS275 / FY16936) TaxID=402676 RepID=B6K832_SCHJY|nr:U3 snoRNP-associated protein Utp7 [Schizosaccharomyces japonicus yFS275]EEB09686.1 U3 snoRNP-associated protein Utp7 [Schizosaccharomyces japonicus yFS275]
MSEIQKLDLSETGAVAKYSRGKKIGYKKIRDKKLRSNIQKIEERIDVAENALAGAEFLQVDEPGYLEAEGLEKTYKFTQKELVDNVAIETAQKGFSLKLDKFGGYTFDYTRDGAMVLMGGRKGHIAAFDWRRGKLQTELHLQETVRDVKWFHNHQYFAVAQKKYVYVYDNTGTEIHCLKRHIEVNAMDFLPYHLLLTTIGNAGYLKYQDVSTGQLVSELRTGLGASHVLRQNPYNAVMHVGHANGQVTLWAPTSTTPLVKMLCHRGPIRDVAIDREGKYMVTAGADSLLKVWDVRTFKEVHSYYTPTPSQRLSLSDRGVLAVGWGPHVTMWKDALRTKQKSPYMNHLLPSSSVVDLHYCPYEDILGVGHQNGFESLIVPGSGEPNYDSYENNPFASKKQRQETEVRQLLEKLRPDMISLTPEFIGTVDRAAPSIRKAEVQEEKPKEEKWVPRDRARGKNSALRRVLRKRAHNVVDERRLKVEQALAREKEMRAARVRREQGLPALKEKWGPALARFAQHKRT